MKSKKWSCIEQCGACCKLEPYERLEALDALSSQDQDLYISMVGTDGWCKYYDKPNKKCNIYEDRPLFCKVSQLSTIFNIPIQQANDFAIKCCKQHIKYIYGPKSKVMKRFSNKINLDNKDSNRND